MLLKTLLNVNVTLNCNSLPDRARLAELSCRPEIEIEVGVAVPFGVNTT